MHLLAHTNFPSVLGSALFGISGAVAARSGPSQPLAGIGALFAHFLSRNRGSGVCAAEGGTWSLARDSATGSARSTSCTAAAS